MKPSIRKLAIVVGTHFVRRGNQVYSPNDTFFRFIKTFFRHFDRISFCSSVVNEDHQVPHLPHGYQVDKLFDYVTVPPYWTWLGYVRKLPTIALQSYEAYCAEFRNSDLIWIRMPSPNAYVAFRAARATNKPVVLYVASNLRKTVLARLSSARCKRFLAHSFFWMYDQLAAAMIRRSLTFALGAELVDQTRRLAGPRAFIHPAFPSTVSHSDLFRKTTSHSPKTIRILSVGRLSPEKQISRLIESVSCLWSEGYDIALDVVGDATRPSHRQTLEALAIRLPLPASRITFHGQVTDPGSLDRLYRGADVFALPSISEGFPKVLVEAMARSLVPVASAVGGIPDIVTSEKNGLLVEPGNTGSLTAALRRVVSDYSLRMRMGEMAYRTAIGMTAEAETDRLMNIVQSHYAFTRTLET